MNDKKKVFPSYFSNFTIPKWAREQELTVFRACATGKVDKLSFLNSFEENGCSVSIDGNINDPSEYSLSTYTKYKDVRRFMTMTSKYHVPFIIAVGKTDAEFGVCLETKEWKKHMGIKVRSSHVDWWLYEDSEPWTVFKEVNNSEYREYNI